MPGFKIEFNYPFCSILRWEYELKTPYAFSVLGLRHEVEEQRNALQSIARDQKNIHSLMLLNDQDYLIWMAGGAVYRVPSLQVNCLFTSVFVEKIR